jgi:hypothetical protein
MAAVKPSIVPSSDGKTRVQLDFSPAVIERMNRSIDICEFETRKDLFNNALSLFDWAIGEVMKGRVIASLDEENKHYTKLAMPALMNAARFAVRGPHSAPAMA